MLSDGSKHFLEVLLKEYRKTNYATINEFLYSKNEAYFKR